MNNKILEQIKFDIQNLEIKKLFKINENGNKIKVRRSTYNEYNIYLNGHQVNTENNWEDSYKMILALIKS